MTECTENMCDHTPDSSLSFFSCGDGTLEGTQSAGRVCKFYEGRDRRSWYCDHVRHISVKGIEDCQCLSEKAREDRQVQDKMNSTVLKKLEEL